MEVECKEEVKVLVVLLVYVLVMMANALIMGSATKEVCVEVEVPTILKLITLVIVLSDDWVDVDTVVAVI